jgi:hypothetical protein
MKEGLTLLLITKDRLPEPTMLMNTNQPRGGVPMTPQRGFGSSTFNIRLSTFVSFRQACVIQGWELQVQKQ